ncbi:644_t:CDS:2, partial [Entrophospora sp. SA101]
LEVQVTSPSWLHKGVERYKSASVATEENEDEIKDKDSQEMTDKLLRITFLQIIK